MRPILFIVNLPELIRDPSSVLDYLNSLPVSEGVNDYTLVVLVPFDYRSPVESWKANLIGGIIKKLHESTEHGIKSDKDKGRGVSAAAKLHLKGLFAAPSAAAPPPPPISEHDLLTDIAGKLAHACPHIKVVFDFNLQPDCISPEDPLTHNNIFLK